MITIALISSVFLAQHSFSSYSSWDYNDMSEWSGSYSMCDTQDQSPIAIQTSDVVYDEAICHKFFDWDIEYDITDFRIINNAHSIVLQPAVPSNIDPDHELESTLIDIDGTEYQTLTLSENTIATFPNYFKPDNSPHEQFCLHSIHFHWGLTDETGSEHFVDGHQYPLEAHFLHYSCQHASLGTTFSQFASEKNVSKMEQLGQDSHQISIVGIFFDIVEYNESGHQYSNLAFESLLNLDAMEILPGHDDKIIHELNLKDLLPENIKIEGYYAYEGSITSPPCTNIVRWHIMNARGKIGKSQMEKFRKLYMSYDGQLITPIAPNYREIQENANTVYGCMDAPQFEPTQTKFVEIKQTEFNVSNIVEEKQSISIAIVAIIGSFSIALMMYYINKKIKTTVEINKSNARASATI